MPIIVESVATSAEMLDSAIRGESTLVPNLEELKRRLVASTEEYAVVLGPSVDLEAASALADTLRITRHATSVILVRRRVDTSVLAEALRSGMREVVEERDLTGLNAAVERAARVWEALNGPMVVPAGGGGKLITVFSPKGGVGKTTLAVNLGIALADGGRNKVCLVDLDLGFGDVAITLQLFPSRTIADAVAMGGDLDLALVESLLTPHRDGLMTLAAPVQPDAKDSIPSGVIGQVLRILKANFSYVIVDTSPTFDDQVLQAFDETDVCLLLATLDVPTLKNVKLAIETLDLLNVAVDSRRLVLNRADDKVGLTSDKVESILGMKISCAIPASSQVASATNSGHPIVAALPRHPVSQAISGLAGSLVGPAKHVRTEAKSATSRAGSGRRSGFRGKRRAAS